MKFTETQLKGAFIVEAEPRVDERGIFSKTFCLKEFKSYGLATAIEQCNKSYSAQKGTIRGLHYQVEPHQEAKLIQCINGSIFDVIIDLRDNSSTYGQWFGCVLTARNNKMIFCPKGFAHGFQTLEDHTLAFYHSSADYHPQSEKGIRYNDPRFNIQWPLEITSISKKDSHCPDFFN